MRLLIVGAGATGGYLGGRLIESGRDVTFLARAGRAAELKRSGLRIVSPHGNAILQPQIVTAETLAGVYDVVLLAVKAYHLETAMADMAPAIGPETVILPTLNGMRHMERLAERFGPQRLIGGALKLGTTIDDAGRVVQLTPLQDFAYGELDGDETPRIRALDECLRAAPIGSRLSKAIRREMWEKWLLIAALGAITGLMRGTVGEVVACAGGVAFAEKIVDEASAIVQAAGVASSDGFVAFVRATLTEPDSPLTSSMARDVQRGRPVEAEAIVGDLLRRGAEVGVDAPLLSAAYVHLTVHMNRLVTRG